MPWCDFPSGSVQVSMVTELGQASLSARERHSAGDLADLREAEFSAGIICAMP
jgi:hypothetical protein